jgi:hypothetical protein
MAQSTFIRRPPTMARLLFGVVVYAIFAPLVWILEQLGRSDRFLLSVFARQRQQFAKTDPFKGYIPGKQDVFVAVAAKHGTNWMMQIVYQLIYHGNGEFDHIHCVVPWPDMEVGPPVMRGYAIPLEQATQWQTAPECKRVIKTHLNWDRIPYSEDAHYIMVIRDPKDVFVSAYHFINGVVLGPAMPSVNAWFRVFLAGSIAGEDSWAAMSARYWAQRHRPNVLVLSFKSMTRDLRGTVVKVADFLNIHVSDDVIDRVCDKSSFAYMKSIDDRFRPWPMVPWAPDPVMMRKGTHGTSSELLTAEQQRQMDAYFIGELQRLGSDLPYEEFADITPGVMTAPAGIGAV